MESPPCECPVAGFCKRHNVMKNATLHKLCQNNEDYREAWDKGMMPFQENRPKKKLGSKSSNAIISPEKPKYSIGPFIKTLTSFLIEIERLDALIPALSPPR